uniref:Methyltransferase-related family protein n=1 Tax=Rhizophora mucronata TaxID=61149 RepID=A0A2P2NQ21_RHIMU
MGLSSFSHFWGFFVRIMDKYQAIKSFYMNVNWKASVQPVDLLDLRVKGTADS